jgi:hypothetical protein
MLKKYTFEESGIELSVKGGIGRSEIDLTDAEEIEGEYDNTEPPKGKRNNSFI